MRAGWLALVAVGLATPVAAQESPVAHREVLDRYCVACHNDRTLQAGLTLQSVDMERVGEVADEVEVWEKVAHKLRGRAMPPPGRPRPDDTLYDEVAESLEVALDAAAAANPDPGQPPIHRLNRVEYRNAVRDLLADIQSVVDGGSPETGTTGGGARDCRH